VVTGSRAEYGLLRFVMEGIRDSELLDLQVAVTGMHLSPAFGSTYREIEADGFVIDRTVESLLDSDSDVAVAKSIGLGVVGFADALDSLGPDLLVVLGDRFEILAAVAAALILKVPVAHLHGGETTEGAFDESIRHSITKMAHLHFVAAPEYARRVAQMGEDPGRIVVTGGLGIDGIRRLQLMSRDALQADLGLTFGARSLMVTFHPATLSPQGSADQMAALLDALDSLQDTTLLFTMPNADTGGRALSGQVADFVRDRPHAAAFTSLGQLRYLSCLAHVDGVVGNSSSGLIEAPSFSIGTINVGDRQAGRLRAASVIDCEPDRASIQNALDHLFSAEFQATLADVRNPYGVGDASERVVRAIETVELDGILQKRFHDHAVALWPSEESADA